MHTHTYTVAPSAARLTNSLRDVGYDPMSAVADLVDNSIDAGAARIDIVVEADEDPRIMVADDGHGMSAQRVNEALRFGSSRTYGDEALGRYGLGLKTASLSQCRTITVVSRREGGSTVAVRQLDLDLIARFDEWLIVHPGQTPTVTAARRMLEEQFNTVVVWEHLDRLLPGRRDTGHARRRLETWTNRIRNHLAMVFHRYLARSGPRQVTISINGEKIRPWDPFLRDEPATRRLAPQSFELDNNGSTGTVVLDRWILPARNEFALPRDFDRAGGPLRWNRQQGLYIYRADRLVQWGGWAGLRAIDEHTKLARCALSFGTDLDEAFNINVAKMRVSLPAALRPMLERPIGEVSQAAQAVYRSAAARATAETGGSCADGDTTEGAVAQTDVGATTVGRTTGAAGGAAGLALLSAAVQTGHVEELREIVSVLRAQAPDVARSLQLDVL